MARRLTKELQDLEKSPLDFVTCGPANDDIMKWNAMLVGPEGSPYEGGVFNLDLEFPTEYPFKPPKVKFITRIYHPNVKTDTGEICADILNEGWGPTLNVQYVLGTMRQLLEEPSSDNPLEADIARVLSEDRDAFNETARKWTADYAT
mmetsp:Transcript_12770/g.16777  ORF Transcript_12770/g.16777 Transcript_12770/m.16777 type:complete len:148 (-) Transcript_12770:347-790(-)|eukprot:CAMPEP_0117756360 /NCGR_PEP_ID=MMETSP0947-20121206/14029_1 /TAXON_ID=44440 /ORGANISM="Chattonella subsalsa, Strain CCMP2191" /LENGTH=147 /DNA_ID=CAMNT_0005575927 /DNA_START=94 /DNA_END=537 /DNA_ORIENTATION=+